MRNTPTAQKLYDRATESAKETRQAIVTMSSASLGVFFFALTTKADPVLTFSQRWVVLVALCFMAFSTFAGLRSAQSDARWSYAWGREIENRKQDAPGWEREKDYWYKRKLWGERYSLLTFAIGVLVAAIYIALRVFGV